MGTELLGFSTEHYILVIREQALVNSAPTPLLNFLIIFIP